MRVRSVLVIVGMVVASRANAQPAPTFEAGKKADVKDVKEVTWTAKGEAGLVTTTGNSRTTTITGARTPRARTRTTRSTC